MKRVPKNAHVSVIVKYIDEEGKIVGLRESLNVEIPLRQFEDIIYQLSALKKVNPKYPEGMPRSTVEYRQMFISTIRRFIVDTFLSL